MRPKILDWLCVHVQSGKTASSSELGRIHYLPTDVHAYLSMHMIKIRDIMGRNIKSIKMIM